MAKTDKTGGADRMAWFRDARFGMFIHWGAYSAGEKGEINYWGGMSRQEYIDKCANRLTASKYDPAKWAALGKQAGCRYMVMTSKHYDGFCMFNTKQTDFNSVRIGPRRDLVAEYVRACRAAGLKVGLYYNLHNFWQRGGLAAGHGWTPHANNYTRADHQDYYKFVGRQVEELLTQYGRIDILWYDIGLPNDPDGRAGKPITAMARRLQPHIIVNCRDGNDNDFDTPENVIIASKPGRMWETCMTVGQWWGYHRTDAPLRSTAQLVLGLMSISGSGGNLCLNIGPKADGTVPAWQESRFREIGRWMARNGESLYGSRRGLDVFTTCGHSTVVGNRLYVHAFRYEAPECRFRGLVNPVTKITCLATGKPVAFEQQDDVVRMTGLPRKAPDPIDTVYRVEVKGELKSTFP
jgi:alpha-L-fucosidase